jgi:hypothetical protein
MSYLTDETRGRHVLVVCVKWQNGADRQIHRYTDTQMKKGPRRPSPSALLRYRGVKIESMITKKITATTCTTKLQLRLDGRRTNARATTPVVVLTTTYST